MPARNYASEAAVGASLVGCVEPSFSKLALLALEYAPAILVNVSGLLESATWNAETPVPAFRTPQNPHLMNENSGDACIKEQGARKECSPWSSYPEDTANTHLPKPPGRSLGRTREKTISQ